MKKLKLRENAERRKRKVSYINLIHAIEVRDLKAKKKMIDKLLKLRQDTDEMMMNRRVARPGGVGGDQETNNILFVEGLSRVTSHNKLISVFSGFAGFKEVRHIPEKQVAFIEFDNDMQAAQALQEMNGHSFKENNGETTNLRISFAKR
jgi:hypothetical protein